MDINQNTSVYMEIIQLLLRKWNISDGYNLCKEFSRSKVNIDLEDFVIFLKENNIDLSDSQESKIYQIKQLFEN